jgi:hypothetical protein
MKIRQKTFIDTYSHKETDELLSLHSSGHLTSEAYDALEEVLRNRGIEPVKRPTLLEEVREKESVDSWGNFFLWLFIALILCVTAHRIFLPDLPKIDNVMPGSLQEIVGRIFSDAVEFTVVFIVVSILTIMFNRLGRYSVKAPLPKLLKVALIWTIIIEALIIFGCWYAAQRMI